MDVLEKIMKVKDEKAKQKALEMVVETLKHADEEFYYEEETDEIASRKYINDRLILEGGSYYLRDDIKREKPYCKRCWVEDHMLNPLQKKENLEYYCVVCTIKNNDKT